jgi:protein O-mannosyl-transferase
MPRTSSAGSQSATAARVVSRARLWFLAAVLLAAVAWVYLPVVSADYIWDDDSYVVENRNLETAGGLWRIWFEPRSSPQYYPLVFASFWLERQAFGEGPTSHHVVNTGLHALNALLLWGVLRRLRVTGAYAVALVFAVHPVHLESVAWITERKNVLSGAFYLAALWAYLRAAGLSAGEPRAVVTSGRAWYVASLLLFAGALLSKTVTATLPAVLLLLHWWVRGGVTARDWIRVAPFFALGLVAGLGTAWLEVRHVGALGEEWTLGFTERILLAGRVPWFYTQKLLWPEPLIFVYPRWDVSLSGVQLLYPLATAAVVAGLYAARARLGRGPVVAVAFFLVTLFPAMGFFDVYPMRYSYVADHFQYLASIGVIALVVGTTGWLLARGGWGWAGVGLAAIVVAALALTARAETAKYQGLEALWRDTLAKNPGAWMAHNNLGTRALRQQRWRDAERHFHDALAIKPDVAEANNNLGTALYAQGRFDAAAEQYRVAVAVKPGNAGAWNNLGIALAAAQRYDEAVPAYRSALALDPTSAMAHYNLGNVMLRTNDREAARGHYRDAIRHDPDLAMAHYQLGLILLADGTADAGAHLRRAFELEPGFAEGHFQVGNVHMEQGRAQEAIDSYTAAIAADPAHADAYSNRGSAHLYLGRADHAMRDYAEALRLQPDHAAAQEGMRLARARANRAGSGGKPGAR